MIYAYGLERELFMYLYKELPIYPTNTIKNIKNNSKLRKLVKPNDLVLFWGWGEGDRKLQKDLIEMGIKLFPEGKTSIFLGDKINQLKLIDTITKFPLNRIMYKGDNKILKEYLTPNINNNKVVLKIGNAHQGENKYLKNENDLVRTKENIIFEEYLENARSIRILLITDKNEDIFIVDYIPKKYKQYSTENNWIGNIDCENIVYNYENRYLINIDNIDAIIEDALKIKKYLKLDYLGIDYVVNSHKTGILEVNDMIGLPDNEEVLCKAKKYFLNKCKEYLEI